MATGNMVILAVVTLMVVVLDLTSAVEVNDTMVPGQNKTGNEDHSHITLVSWRWEEYHNFIYITFILMLAAFLKIGFHHIPFVASHLPESCVLIIFGVLMAVVIRSSFGQEAVETFPQFTHNVFFHILLPPIVLDASYSMYNPDFFDNLGAILIYALVGTVLSASAFGFILFGLATANWVHPSGPSLTLIQCLIFGSITSAVDPVAVLAIFEEVHVNSVLYFLVFGESLLNDGVTIVLYNSVTVLGEQEHIATTECLMAVASFFTVVVGGLAIGLAIGFISSLTLRFTNYDVIRPLEPLIIITTAYFAYILAETLHWSGIISMIGCGIMQKRYAFLNASKKTYTTVKYSVKTLASVSDCIIFIFLGKVMVDTFNDLELNAGLILWTLVLCLVVRFAVIFLLTAIINPYRKAPISVKEQFIMAYGGLRGAVGFSLAYILNDDNPHKASFLAATLALIVFTVFIQGGTIRILVKKLHIVLKVKHSQNLMFTEIEKKACEYLMAGIDSILGDASFGSYIQAVQNFDNKYLKKLLVRKGVQDRMTMKLQRITVDEHYARLYGPNVLVYQQQQQRKSSVIEPPVAMIEATVVPVPDAPEFHRQSLKRALHSNSYERGRRQGEEHFEDLVLRQLRARSLQTRQIEDMLIGKTGQDDGNSQSEDDDVPTLRRRRRKTMSHSNSGRDEASDGGIMLEPIIHRRTMTLSGLEVRRQFIKAKQRYSSIDEC